MKPNPAWIDRIQRWCRIRFSAYFWHCVCCPFLLWQRGLYRTNTGRVWRLVISWPLGECAKQSPNENHLFFTFVLRYFVCLQLWPPDVGVDARHTQLHSSTANIAYLPFVGVLQLWSCGIIGMFTFCLFCLGDLYLTLNSISCIFFSGLVKGVGASVVASRHLGHCWLSVLQVE